MRLFFYILGFVLILPGCKLKSVYSQPPQYYFLSLDHQRDSSWVKINKEQLSFLNADQWLDTIVYDHNVYYLNEIEISSSHNAYLYYFEPRINDIHSIYLILFDLEAKQPISYQQIAFTYAEEGVIMGEDALLIVSRAENENSIQVISKEVKIDIAYPELSYDSLKGYQITEKGIKDYIPLPDQAELLENMMSKQY